MEEEGLVDSRGMKRYRRRKMEGDGEGGSRGIGVNGGDKGRLREDGSRSGNLW